MATSFRSPLTVLRWLGVKANGISFLVAGHVLKCLLLEKLKAGFAWMMAARSLVASLQIDSFWK